MAKNGEINYLNALGKDGINHALNKPYSDAGCGTYITDIGIIFQLLPNTPARLLDLGCGTGWTSCMFAKRGYQVVGQDIAPDMIANANKNKIRENLDNVEFIVSDYENMSFNAEFDCAVFYDSLHHAIDEELALKQVYKALAPNGICILVEAGKNHHKAQVSLEAVKKYGVTEKEMHPKKVSRIATKVGFSSFRIIPRISFFRYERKNFAGKSARILKLVEKLFGKTLADYIEMSRLFLTGKSNGIIILKK